MELKYFKREGFIQAPKRSHRHDAGADVVSTKTITIAPHTTEKISLGIGVEVPVGFMGLILPRSGHASRGLVPASSPIDTGYTGAIHAIMTNTTNEPYHIEKGERIAQLVIMPIALPTYVEETEYDDAKQRGDSGFNSTGL